MNWQNNIEEYLKDLLGQELAVKPVHQKEMHGLPFYLTKAYEPYDLILFEKRVVVLQTKTEVNESPGRIAKDVSKIRKHFDRDVAIVFENLASWERKRLIEKKIPFIVPGRQLYLPMLFLDLREYFPRRVASSQEYLSRPTQYALLRQILYGDVENRRMGEVAKLLGYSAMMVTKIKNELGALNLCTAEADGRSRRIVFSGNPEYLWSRGCRKMRSPVFKRHFFAGRIVDVQLAGTSGLAKQSMLEPDDRPTFAVWKKSFKNMLEEYNLVEIQDEDGADFILEEWYYDPQKLSDETVVDPLSLYLSLRDNPDERIQIALEEMLETTSWSKE